MLMCDKDAWRLIDDLLKNYDSVVRPVTHPNEQIKLYLGLKLSQISEIVNLFYFIFNKLFIILQETVFFKLNIFF